MLRRLLLLVLAVALVALPGLPGAAGAGQVPLRLSVLPFETRFPDLKPYEDGMMDSLIAGLRQLPQLVLVDRGRIQHVLREQAFGQSGLVDPASAVKLGRLLQAQALVTGSMQQAGRQMVVVANVVDVETGQIRATQRVRGKIEDIFDLQDQLAEGFVKSFKLATTPAQRQRVLAVLKSTASLTAYDYYLKGRTAFLQFDHASLQDSIGWYRKAQEVDPRYALAYAGEGESWALMAEATTEYGDREEGQAQAERALAASQRALALNPDLAEAHRSLGLAAASLRRLGDEGRTRWLEEVRKAVALAPNDAASWYYLWLAEGRHNDPDHPHIVKALALNPDLVEGLISRGFALAGRQRGDEAQAALRRAVELRPRFPLARYFLGELYQEMGRRQEAIHEYEEALRLYPGYTRARRRLDELRGR